RLFDLSDAGTTILVSTHYMDEAERCHRLAYISYGKLLANGTVSDVIQQARLTTWSVSGPHLHQLAVELRRQPAVQQAVAFGDRLHVSGADPVALETALAAFRTGPYVWHRVDTGLEDVFIHLMEQSSDKFAS
ncbi:MAG TPA: multidrug ABC transporter ATP-binding protein, partial [Nitrospira sp.]|nr:multidrug ABC transporter ATP-binding protein [Nitrospira sp.]